MAGKGVTLMLAKIGPERALVPMHDGVIVIPEAPDKASAGDAEAARRLFGLIGYALEADALGDAGKARLISALRMLSEGAPAERAFMPTPHARVKTGNKNGSKRAGSASIRDRALQLLREMDPKTDADVVAGIRKLQQLAGVKSHKTIEADIKKQLAAEVGRPTWPAPTVPRLNYDELREKYPDMGHEFWAWAARLD